MATQSLSDDMAQYEAQIERRFGFLQGAPADLVACSWCNSFVQSDRALDAQSAMDSVLTELWK